MAARAAGPYACASQAAAAVAARARDDRVEHALAGLLVMQPVLLDERLAVEAERLGVGAQEALYERRPRQQSPLFVLERPQVLGADLGLRLDLGYVDALTHPRLAQRCSDLRHRRGVYPPKLRADPRDSALSPPLRRHPPPPPHPPPPTPS